MFEAYVCDKIRTRDLLVRSQTLYPAELHTHSFRNDIRYITSKPHICQAVFEINQSKSMSSSTGQ